MIDRIDDDNDVFLSLYHVYSCISYFIHFYRSRSMFMFSPVRKFQYERFGNAKVDVMKDFGMLRLC